MRTIPRVLGRAARYAAPMRWPWLICGAMIGGGLMILWAAFVPQAWASLIVVVALGGLWGPAVRLGRWLAFRIGRRLGSFDQYARACPEVSAGPDSSRLDLDVQGAKDSPQLVEAYPMAVLWVVVILQIATPPQRSSRDCVTICNG